MIQSYENPSDRNELRLRDGDLIEVLARDQDSPWAVGQLRGNFFKKKRHFLTRMMSRSCWNVLA